MSLYKQAAGAEDIDMCVAEASPRVAQGYGDVTM